MLIILGTPYIIQVKDTNEKVLLSGLEQTLFTNSPCVIQGKEITFLPFE